MQHNTRARSGMSGWDACVCRYCCSTGGKARKYKKNLVIRAIRRGEKTEIQEQIQDHENHDGDIDFIVATCKLNVENAKNIRSTL